MKVTVVWATLQIQESVALDLPAGASVADAVAASGLIDRHRLDRAEISLAIFGRRARADAPLSDGDRIELTRPLAIDPKTARVERARRKPLARAAPAKKSPTSD